MTPVDVWFDYASPFAYLGACRVEAVAAAYGAAVRWRPMVLGGVFRAVGTPMVPLLALGPAKQAYVREDMLRWARAEGIPFRFPGRFPLRTILPLRMTLCVDAPGPLIRAIFHAAWAEDQDISDPDVLRALLPPLGLPADLPERAQAPEVKERLHRETAEAVARGVFGAPTFAVGDELFFGQDRLVLVARELRRLSGVTP